MTVPVAAVDPQPNGLAELLSRLIGSNLERDPSRRALLARATVELEAVDAGVSATVHVRPEAVEVSNGPANPGWDLRVEASSADLLELSSAPLLLGLPNPLHRDGRAVLAGVLRRRVRIAGMLRHPVRLSRFARLLSVR